MYYRFVTSRRDAASLLPEGIFCTAYRWRDATDPLTVVNEWLWESLGWFQVHLDVPDDVPERAIFWFRSGSVHCHRATWSLVFALRELGETVFVLRTPKPGAIVFADDDQVAAVPHRDTWWRADAF